jgi:RNA polymerase sigma factor (sigma-70 family)
MSQPPSLESLASSLYETHAPLLMNIAIRKYGVPRSEALTVTHDTFVSFMRVGVRVRNPRRWLIAAVCNSSRQYLRDHDEPPRGGLEEADLATEVDTVLGCIDAAKLLSQLSPICRKVLEDHYLMGHSAREIGETRDTTTRYVEREIHRCLENARRIILEDDHASQR